MTTLRKTFAEFFAGIGLVRQALHAGGWSCTYANDIDPKKREIYVARFGDTSHFHLGDVWETPTVKERMKVAPFLATASFPCVDLSLAGHWRGLDGEHSSAFFGFANAIAALGRRKPKLILLENVAGFLTSRGGADFRCVATNLGEMGYWLDAFLIDARFFVPQSRPRVFIVGMHASLAKGEFTRTRQLMLFGGKRRANVVPGPLRPTSLVSLIRSTDLPTGWLEFRLPLPVPNQVELKSMIDRDDAQPWWDGDAVRKHYNMMSDRHRKLVDELIAAGGVHVGTIYRRKRHGKTRAEVRFDGIAGCLRTPRGGSARQIVVIIENGRLRLRWMSPREYARLQGAPDYPILDNVNQMLFGFGDGVCVPVVQWIDEQLLTPAFNWFVESRKSRTKVGG